MSEYNKTPDEFPSAKEDISAVVSSESGKDERRTRRKSFKNSLLLQAASAIVAAVIITSSFGVDFLGIDGFFGGGMSSGNLDNQLQNSGAKEGIITVSMMWQTTDDMDLHVRTPSGAEIFYSNPEAAGGSLDIDMQVSTFVAYPVENIYFSAPERGTYTVSVEKFSDRTFQPTPVFVRVKVLGQGTKEFKVTVDSRQDIYTFTY